PAARNAPFLLRALARGRPPLAAALAARAPLRAAPLPRSANVGARLRAHGALALLLQLAAGAASSFLRAARRRHATRLSSAAPLAGLVRLVAASAYALRPCLGLVRLRPARPGPLRSSRLGDLRALLVLLFLRYGAAVFVGPRNLFHDPAGDRFHPGDGARGEAFRFVLVAGVGRCFGRLPGAAHQLFAGPGLLSGAGLHRWPGRRSRRPRLLRRPRWRRRPRRLGWLRRRLRRLRRRLGWLRRRLRRLRRRLRRLRRRVRRRLRRFRRRGRPGLAGRARRGAAMRPHLIEAAVPLLSGRAIALRMLWLLVFHRSLH